ncbi:MAG: MMPL family transporter [Thermoguttaceae bacterium]|nr:MMPL family transporter [Thermoguttaceae bacterium]
MKPFFSKSRSIAFVLLFLFLLPFIFAGYHYETQYHYSNRIDDWLPSSFEETDQLKWLNKEFGVTDLIAVAWDAIRLGDAKIKNVAQALAALKTKDAKPYFQKVITADDSLARFPDEMENTEKKTRLEGWLLGPDHEKTALVCLVSKEGYEDRARMVDLIFATVEKTAEVPLNTIHVAGPVVDSVSLDRVSVREIPVLTGVSFALALLIIWIGFRNIRLSLYCFTVAVVSEVLSYALLFYTGTQADSVSLLMGTLVFVVGISGTILLTRYYVNTVAKDGAEGAVSRAVRMGFVPGFLSAATTVVGIGSLGVSQIVPVARFGIFSAIAICIEFCLIFILLPSLWTCFPMKDKKVGKRVAVQENDIHKRWMAIVRGDYLFRYVIILLAVAAIFVSAVGLTKITTTIRIHGLLKQDEKIIVDYDWLEKNIGALIPVELVVSIPRRGGEKTIDEVDVVQQMRLEALSVPGVASAMAADSFVPEIPEGGSIRNVSRRSVINKRIEAAIPSLQDAGFLRRHANVDHWRITLRVPSGGVDYGVVVKELRSKLSPYLIELYPGATIRYTGAVPLVHQTQKQLLVDLINSFMTAFLLVAIMMMLLLFPWNLKEAKGNRLWWFIRKSMMAVCGGCVVMIPALVPCMIVFGTLGFMNYPVNLGVVMTASVALGIAVDGTIHFIVWFRRATARGNDPVQAVLFAFSRCGASILQTSIVCCLGFLAFAFSSFVPTVLFSYFMVILLGSALLGVLIILPALLMSPLGWLVRKDAVPMRNDD